MICYFTGRSVRSVPVISLLPLSALWYTAAKLLLLLLLLLLLISVIKNDC